MVPATRSTRRKAPPARSHGDSDDAASDAPEPDRDARPAGSRRSTKRARGNDAPARNTRAKRPNNDVGPISSLGRQSTGSAASRKKAAGANPSATPAPTAEDTEMCNMINSSMHRGGDETIETDTSARPSSAEAAFLSNNGDAGGSDDNSGTRSLSLDADQWRETSESRGSSPTQHDRTSENSTPIQPPGDAPGAATPTTQRSNDPYDVPSDLGDGEENASNGGADADSTGDVVDTATEEIDSDVDFEVLSDMNEDNSLSLEAAFNQDIVEFETRAPVQSEDSLFFSPSEDPFDFSPSGSSTTINLVDKPFLKVFKHMKRKGWTGVQQGWDTQIVQTRPKTTVGEVLLHFVRKIERLYKMGSGQRDITAQTAFLNEHTKPLQYYFGMVAECVRFIRDKRLPLDTTEPLSRAGEKRKQMAMDLADPLIPWLVRLLKATWQLGGPESCNDFTIQLMIRTVRWIRQLYNTLQREVKATPVPEKKKKKGKTKSSGHSDEDREEEWRKWTRDQKARDQLDAMLQESEAFLNKAPDMLTTEENRQADLKAERERSRVLEAKKAEQDRLEQERREKERMRQNQNVVRSLRCAADDGWIEPEVDYLQGQLQGATHPVPTFPSLQDTARRVGHSVEDTMDKSKKELRKMLGMKRGNVLSPKQIEAEVKNLMQLWRLRYP